MKTKRVRLIVAATLWVVTTAAAQVGEGEAKYYADFSAAAKTVGKELNRLGDYLAKTNVGRNYSGECKKSSAKLAAVYHDMETMVPPGDAVKSHRALMESAELGARVATELVSFFDAQFEKPELVATATDLYEQAVDKYALALGGMPEIGEKE